MAKASDLLDEQAVPSRPRSRTRKFPHQTFDYRGADGRAKTTSKRAYDAALTYLRNEPHIDFKPLSLSETICTMSVRFWEDKLLDELAKRGQVKAHLKGLGSAIFNSCERLSEIEHILDYYKMEYADRPIFHEMDGLDIYHLRTELGTLWNFCEAFAKQRFSKKGTGSHSIRNVCLSLWELREQLTGRPFVRNFDPAGGKQKNMTVDEDEKEFVGQDAQFVHTIARAIDPKIGFKTIRTSLREIAELRPKLPSKPVRNARKNIPTK